MKRILLLCLLAAACDSPTVPQRLLRDIYEFRALTPEPEVLRWPIGSTVNVFVVADADATNTQWLRDATSLGADEWNAAAIYGEVDLRVVNRVEDADVVVEYSAASSPVDVSGCIPSGSFAYTTFCLTSDRAHLTTFPLKDGSGGHVKFLVTIRSGYAPDVTTLRGLVAHELGHVLGIARHSPKSTDLMYGGTTLLRTDPSPADRATLQVLYHTEADITP